MENAFGISWRRKQNVHNSNNNNNNVIIIIIIIIIIGAGVAQ